jgi:hypothetical protein
LNAPNATNSSKCTFVDNKFKDLKHIVWMRYIFEHQLSADEKTKNLLQMFKHNDISHSLKNLCWTNLNYCIFKICERFIFNINIDICKKVHLFYGSTWLNFWIDNWYPFYWFHPIFIYFKFPSSIWHQEVKIKTFM